MRDPLQPGQWPSNLSHDDYRRLVLLAERRLVGYQQHAEDVVSRALMKWAKISPEKAGVAHIEQVIKTEAYSVLRSLSRSRVRDTGHALHQSGDGDPAAEERNYVLLRQAMAETCIHHRITITTVDTELLELLLAGLTQEQTRRVMGLPRHQVRRSRAIWQRVVQLMELETLADERPSV